VRIHLSTAEVLFFGSLAQKKRELDAQAERVVNEAVQRSVGCAMAPGSLWQVETTSDGADLVVVEVAPERRVP